MFVKYLALVLMYMCGKTMQTQDILPPNDVMAMAMSPRSITVMWEEVVPMDQNVTGYEVLYQPLETFGGAIGPLTVNVTELTADLTDLEEYVSYNISVRAYISAGEGPYSEDVTVITMEDAPVSPPSNVMVTAASPTTIMVTWDMVPPIDQNGVITLYGVLYEPLETFGGAIGPLTMNVNERSSLLTGLQEYVNYTISVRAYTSAGEGPYSDGVTVVTPTDAPSSPPSNVMAAVTSLTTIVVTWDIVPPIDQNGVILGYEVMLEGPLGLSFSVTATELTAELRVLDGLMYLDLNISVRAFTVAHFLNGPYSDAITILLALQDLPTSGLFFSLNGTVYLPGDTILITDIGETSGGEGLPRAGMSLVCVTRNVNTRCCRQQDTQDGGDGGEGGELGGSGEGGELGGSGEGGEGGEGLGQWFFPDGLVVPNFDEDPLSNFTRTAFLYQVRMERRNNAASPTGTYECRVPDENTGELVNASITLTAGFLNLTITPSKPPSVLLGDYISLNCSPIAPTSEDISYTWTHLNTSTVLGETSNILTFPRISLEQLGTYHCSASSTSSGAEITITSARPLIEAGISPAKITQGSQCPMTGDDALVDVIQLLSAQFGLHPLGLTMSYSAESCDQVADVNPDSPSGTYWIYDTDRNPVQVQCQF